MAYKYFKELVSASLLPTSHGARRVATRRQKMHHKLPRAKGTHLVKRWVLPLVVLQCFMTFIVFVLFLRSLYTERILRSQLRAAASSSRNGRNTVGQQPQSLRAGSSNQVSQRVETNFGENKDKINMIRVHEDISNTFAEEDFEKDAEDDPRVPRDLLPPRMSFTSTALLNMIEQGAFDPHCSAWRPGNRSRIHLATLPQQMLVEEHYDFVPGSTMPNNPQSYFFCRAARRLGWTRPAPLKLDVYDFFKGKPGPEKRWLRDIAKHRVTLICHGSGDLNIMSMKRAKESWEENHIALLERWEDSFMSSMTKVDQFNGLRKVSKKLGCDPIKMGLYVESYDMSDDKQCRAFFDKAETDPNMSTALWLAKLNQHVGSGIKFRTYEEAKALYSACKNHFRPFLLQRAVENTLLLDGRKWDARVLVLVASHRPTLVYAFDILHIRASLKKILDPEHIAQQAKNNHGAFLTNSHLQNGAKSVNWNEHNWSHAKLIEHAREAGVENPDILPEIIFKRAQNIIELTFHSMGTLSDRAGRFKIYGFDFVVDRDLKPSLLEINYNPGADFRLRTEHGKQMFGQLYEDAITLVHDVQVGSAGTRVKPRHGHFHLTYHRDQVAQKYWDRDGAVGL